MHSTRRSPRLAAWPFALLLALALAPSVRAAEMLADSTTRDFWRLPNGLEVRTFDVPGAAGVAITAGYRAGYGFDTPGREGLAELLAEIQFTGPAGATPARSRAEMESLRPLGWGLHVDPHVATFTEIARRAQVPGVLLQVASRMRGVTVNDSLVDAARATLRRDLAARYFGDPEQALYWRVAALARGELDEAIVRRASATGIAALHARDVAPLLHRFYVPANASLAVVGDLSGLDVHALVTAAFGSIPAGVAQPDTIEERFRAGERVSHWKGLAHPIGVVAVRAPALEDSLHPAFYRSMLLTSAAITKLWADDAAHLKSRFQYSIYDDPEMVRFDPPAPAGADSASSLAQSLYENLDIVSSQVVPGPVLRRIALSVSWLLGGPLPPDVHERMRREPAALGTLANGVAVRPLWRGDAYWREYVGRMLTSELGHSAFYDPITLRENQARLLLVP